jgi:hypothetical protein
MNLRKSQFSRRKGLTFIEVLVSLMFFAMLIFPLFVLSSMATRGSMDAYYEFLAGSLGQEPIDVFRSLGYKWLVDYSSHPIGDYPLAWKDLTDSDWQKVPTETGVFRRRIEIIPCPAQGDEPKVLLVRVTIAPKGSTWLSRDQTVVEAFIVEEPE